MKKRFLIPIFVIFALITGLFLGTIGSAATYNQPLYSTTQSTDLQKDAANQRNGGQVYYVDGNVINDQGDGTSWATAYQKLSTAMAASHANIGLASNRAWAARNIIYARGDRLTETLIAFPQKTDIVGVGSCDNFTRVAVRGNHAPVNAAVGTRFFNIQFEPTTAAVIMTLTSASTGIEFHGCIFEAWGAAAATTAIKTTAHGWLKVEDCEFNGAYSDTVIDIAAGNVNGMRILRNSIQGGAQNGIEVTGTTTVTRSMMALIADNLIQVAGFVILDGDDDTINVMRNRCISAGATEAAAFEIDEGHAVDNVITYNDTTSVMVPIIP